MLEIFGHPCKRAIVFDLRTFGHWDRVLGIFGQPCQQAFVFDLRTFHCWTEGQIDRQTDGQMHGWTFTQTQEQNNGSS